MSKDYQDIYDHLAALMERYRSQAPDVMDAFGKLHEASSNDGALDVKTKELIALGIGIAVHCDGCIAYHTHDALKAGATQEEIVDTISVAVLMGGGPSVVYGCQALEAAEQFQLAPTS